MGQTLGAKGRSRRRTKRPAQNRLRVVVTYLLLISIVFSNISNPLFNVFAGQKTEKEEFRIYADELQRAAEEAFDDDEPLEEALEIDSKDKTLLKNYQKLFEADGRLYEIFPEYETVNEIDGITLRTFIRIAEDADPKSYMLTGEEELIFLYVNDGDASVSCRVNIDGYISAYCTVKPYESVFGENEETIVSGSGVTAGTGSGSGSGSGSGQTAEEAPVKDETAAAEDTKETEAPADTADEENSQKEENEAADKEEEAPAEDDKTDETGDKDDAEAPADDSRDEESENNGDEADASENTGDSDTADEADGADSNDSSDDTADEADGSDDGGDEADEGGSSDSGDTSDDAGSSDDSSVEIGMSINVRHLLATSIQAEEEEEAEETEEEEPEETEAETEESTEVETEESTEAETGESTEAETGESTEAAEAEAEEGAADAETKETTAGTVPETAVMADTPYEVKIVDEEEEDAFERVGSLDGKTYNIVALEQYKTARAFVIDFSESGLDKETLESTGHFITYTVDPTGSAELVHTAKLVRDGAEVAFGIVPQEGYKIAEVTSNGDELAIIDISDVERTATASEATRSEAIEDATRSEALREDAIYYEIPEVLEDQEVMILLEEIVPGSHPAFHQAKTVNGVTVSVSAEEGILPEGTELSVEEVTEQVEEVVREKVESETEDTTTVTSVIAYDINLMLDGKKLNNDWGENNYVTVQFSGERIEEVSKEADTVQIASLVTPTEMVEAALGGTEEMPMVQNLSVGDIEVDTEEFVPIEVKDDDSVHTVKAEARHFSVYVVIGSASIQRISDTAEANLYSEGSASGSTNVTINGSSYHRVGTEHVTFVVGEDDNVSVSLNDGREFSTVYYRVTAGNWWNPSYSYYPVTEFKITKNPVTSADTDASGAGTYEIVAVYQNNNTTNEATYVSGTLSLADKYVTIDNVSTKVGKYYQLSASEDNSDSFFWITSEEENGYDLYFYTLLPTLSDLYQYKQTSNADAYWNGMGVGKITGVYEPSSYGSGTEVDGTITEPSTYPDIAIYNNDGSVTWYKYAADGTPEANMKGYYTISWVYTVVSNQGANKGANEYNPLVSSGWTFHRDGQIRLNMTNYLNVDFKVQYPGSSEFIIPIGGSANVTEGTLESTLTQPIKDGDVWSENSNYTFDGWYSDPSFEPKYKVDFSGTIITNKTYYGHYILPTKPLEITKILQDGVSFKDATVDGITFKLIETDQYYTELSGGTVLEKDIEAKSIESTINKNEGTLTFEIPKKESYYILEEEDSATGYKKIDKVKIHVTIDSGGLLKVAMEKEASGDLVKVYIADSGDYGIEVTNVPSYIAELPETGGSGIVEFTRCGWFLLLVSAVLAGVETRRYSLRKRED